MMVRTRNGSVYEFFNGKVRRTKPGKDWDWRLGQVVFPPQIGASLTIFLGAPDDEDGGFCVTTPVEEIIG